MSSLLYRPASGCAPCCTAISSEAWRSCFDADHCEIESEHSMARDDKVGSGIGMDDMVFQLLFWKTIRARWRLCQDVVVLNGPLGVTGGVLDLLIAERGIAHTQYA